MTDVPRGGETMNTTTYQDRQADLAAQWRAAHARLRTKNPPVDSFVQLNRQWTLRAHDVAAGFHADVRVRLVDPTLLAVCDHHAPQPGIKMDVRCHGCDQGDDDGHAEWPCSTWLLIAARVLG